MLVGLYRPYGWTPGKGSGESGVLGRRVLVPSWIEKGSILKRAMKS